MSLIENCIELADLHEQLPRFEQQVETLAQYAGIQLNDFYCDHISVRCHQMKTAQRWRENFLTYGDLLSEKEINGRPICLFDLHKPLVVFNKPIDCIELPYPNGRQYACEGWEHIELVVPTSGQPFHQYMLELLSDEILMMPGIKIKCSKPKGDGERLANPTLAITDGIVTIKFHPYSIRDVLASERD